MSSLVIDLVVIDFVVIDLVVIDLVVADMSFAIFSTYRKKVGYAVTSVVGY